MVSVIFKVPTFVLFLISVWIGDVANANPLLQNTGVELLSDCNVEGNFAYPSDCTKYIQCRYTVSNQFEYQLFKCKQGERWDASALDCAPGSCTGPTTTTTAYPTTTQQLPSTSAPPRFQCTSEGYFPDPLNCTKYYYCRKVDDVFYETHNTCPPRTIWNQPMTTCVNGSC